MKDFQKIHDDTLRTARREVKQVIEHGQSNVDWMEKNYEKIAQWLLIESNLSL